MNDNLIYRTRSLFNLRYFAIIGKKKKTKLHNQPYIYIPIVEYLKKYLKWL